MRRDDDAGVRPHSGIVSIEVLEVRAIAPKAIVPPPL
jgi:hypothetical protein